MLKSLLSKLSVLLVSPYSVPMLETQLERIFPGRIFSKPLLGRIRNKTLDDRLGKDRNNLPALAALSEQVIREGGIFLIVLDPESMGIKSIHIQKKSWRAYAEQYGANGPKMVDGSHDWSKHKVIAIPWTGIDGLGFSCIQGVTFNLTENAAAITEGAKHFYSHVDIGSSNSHTDPLDDSLDEFIISSAGNNVHIDTIVAKDSAIMSDEGPSFPLDAKSLGCHHILDRKHFTAQIISSWQQVDEQERDKYKTTIHSILNAPTEQDFNSRITNALSTYSVPQAQAFLKKIQSNRDRLVWAYTSQFFTVGHVSDQRSEVTNSVVKGKGTLKHYLRNGSLFDTVKRLFIVGREWDKKAIDALKDLRFSSRFIGNNYYTHLRNSMADVVKYSYARSVGESSTYIVKETESSQVSYTVNLQGSLVYCGKHFTCITCTCPFFQSTRIICPCACRAAQEACLRIPQPEQIYPYFLVYNHPRYIDACRMLGLSPHMSQLPNPMPNYHHVSSSFQQNSTIHDVTPTLSEVATAVNNRLFDQVGNQFDSLKRNEMVMKYRQTCENIQHLATKSTKHFKWFMCEIAGIQNKLSSLNLSPAVNANMDAISRARTRGRPCDKSIENKSHLQREIKRPRVPMADEVNFSFIMGTKDTRNKVATSKRCCQRCKRSGKGPEVSMGHISSSKHCPSRVSTAETNKNDEGNHTELWNNENMDVFTSINDRL